MGIFIFLLIIHIMAGSFCLLTGAINFFVTKEKGYHTKIGEWYHSGYVIVFITSLGMAIIHWSESAYLFYIAIFSYSLALFGYVARKMQWKGWLSMHIGGMSGSYIGIVTAVLVVNGANIPLINQMPTLFVWFLPTIIGTPIIIFISRRYQTDIK